MAMYSNTTQSVLLTFLVSLLTASSGCGPVHRSIQLKPEDLSTLKTVAVIVPDEGEFTVYLDRATATAAPAAAFGLIGAAIAASHNKSLDTAKMDALSPYLAGFSGRSLFIESFRKTLAESGRLSGMQIFDRHIGGGEVGGYDAIVTLRFKEWGLRLPGQIEEKLAGFLELEAKMTRTRDEQVLWEEHDTTLGQRRHYFSEYKDSGPTFRSEMEETFKAAGARAATKIAYPRGRSN